MILFGKIIEVLIFDLDGTLTTTKSGETFRKTPNDWKWLPGRLEKVRELGQHVHIGIATNQGGIAFGYYPLIDLMAEIQRAIDDAKTIPTRGVKVCWTHPSATIPHYREKNDPRRKPGPGMLLEIMNEFQFPTNPLRVLFVGDLPTDEQAAMAAGCHYMNAAAFFAEKEPEQ